MSALLLLHGFTGAPSSFDAVLAALPRPPRVIAPFLAGHGTPGAAPDVESFESELDRLAALLPEGRHGVVGYSLGARLALGLLVRHPARFSTGVLVSANPGLASERERAERRRGDGEWRRLLDEQGLEPFVDRWERLPLFASQAALPEALRRSERARRLGHTASGLSRSLALTGLAEMPDYLPVLGAIEARVEVLAGGLDERFCAHGEAIVGRLPRGRLTRVADAGHNLLLERPESVAEAIVRGVSP